MRSRTLAAPALAGFLSSLALLAPPAGAQSCFGPDGLAGPCWDPAVANLPALGPFTLDGSGLCWDDCAPVAQDGVQVIFDTPVPVECGRFEVDVEVFDPVLATTVLTGKGTLDYTRTWEEMNLVTLARKQVWRFVAKIDLSFAAAGVATCWTPDCLSVHPAAFHYGYVDLAEDCATGAREHVAVLHHPCDFFMHFPGISSRPGTFHPNEYSAIVAPDTPANPFVPAASVPPSGPLIAEAMRNVRSLLAPACETEDPIVAGNLDLLATACICPLDPTSSAQSASLFRGEGACVDPTGLSSSFQSLNLFGSGLPFAELMRTSLGNWTTSATYPGEEAVWAAEALLSYRDGCDATAGIVPNTLDMVYGASTAGGDFVVSSGPLGTPLGQEFTDVVTNYSEPLPSVSLPIVGGVGPSDHLIYVNTQ